MLLYPDNAGERRQAAHAFTNQEKEEREKKLAESLGAALMIIQVKDNARDKSQLITPTFKVEFTQLQLALTP